MNNQKPKVKIKIIDINNNHPSFYPYSIKTIKCSGSCNNINDAYAKICLPDIVNNTNLKLLNIMLKTNETRLTE